jgi:hypothetical protein
MICYSEGILGTLTENQCNECKDTVILPTTKQMQRHFEKFKELGAVTQVCLSSNEGQTTEDFYKCIGREAHKQI